MDDDRLTVVGRAVGDLAPDRIEWTLIVRETDDDPRAAFARCSQRLGALASALELADVTTGAVAVAAEYDREPRRPTGRHTAYAALTAVAPLALGGEVAAAAMDGGADELRGPHVRLPEAAETIDGLLADAVNAARRRAERMAAAAGRRLGRVVTVRDSRVDEDYEFGDFESRLVRRQSGGGDDGAPHGAPPVIPRPHQISVAVVVTFELTG